MKRNFRLLLFAALAFMGVANSASAEDHYLVGGCTASGWNTGEWQRSPVAMVNVSDNVWVWAGKLTTGEGDNGRFKIPNSAGGWDGYWAPSQGTVLTAEWSDLSTSSQDDNKYCVSEEGIYRIYINTSTLKIKAEKLSEPAKDGDYYLLTSVDDYYWFAGKVTSEGGELKARLTTDLDFAEKGFFPLACDKNKFKGEFDGAGHTLKNMMILGDNKNIGLARYATGKDCAGAYFHDFVLEGSFTGFEKIGGVVGFARDGGEIRLTNVVNRVNVHATGSGNADSNAAGLVACATDGTKITALNCANMGTVSSARDGQCAAFAGWTQSGTTFTNCWNSGSIYNMENNCNLYRNSGSVVATNCFDAEGAEFYTQGTKVANAKIATGEFCFILNGDQNDVNWYQNLSGTVDAYPVPFSSHSQVYANGTLKCDGTSAGGELTYSNQSTSVIPPHTDVNGWCSECGTLMPNHLTADGEGFYSIGSANDLKWFAAIIEKVNQSANARLTADIDYTDSKQGFIGVSQGAPFRGVFDGQGHTVTIDIVNTNNSSRTGLFAFVNAATIRNLVVEGSATSASNNCVGGLGGRSDGDGTLIENVVVKTAVSYTGQNGDATCGGFFANMEAKVTLRNCAFYGSISTGTAEGNGGLVGWAGGSAGNVYENCIVAPVSYTKNGNSADFARNNPATTNCYAVATSDARLASGELAYLLNGSVSGGSGWYQLIGTDALPMPIAKDGATVYVRGSQKCDGTPKGDVSYVNVESEPARDPHNFGEGGAFCAVCDTYNPSYAITKDGDIYLVGDATELKWFAVMANAEGTDKSARLTADIDFTGVANFPGLGTSTNAFTGVLDGQRHIISNLTMDYDREGVGLVNRAANGAQVKNLTIASNCSFKGSKAVAALIGGLYGGGNVYVENCGNEGSVVTTGQNAGGICGVCFNGTILYLTNVYNVGEVSGAVANESGSLSGWMSNAVLKNCYSIAGYPSAQNTHGFQEGKQFARGDGINLTNCYDFGTGLWGQNESTWGAAFADGRKIADVNETTMGRVFAGLYDAEGGNVWRMEYDGWEHPVLYEPAKMVLSENVPARYEAASGKTLTLKRTTVADTWNTICLPFALSAAQIESAFGTGAKVAQLTGSEGETMKFTTVAATEAGKPYLVKPTVAMTDVELTVDLAEANPAAVAQGGYAFTGIFEPTKISANDIFVAAGNKLVPSNGEGQLKGFRAYFKVENTGARFTSFTVDGGEATGIADAMRLTDNGQMTVEKCVFDLQGRRVAQPAKGVYLVNGRKVVIK